MQQTIKLNNFMTLSLSRVQVRARNLRSKIHLDACLQGKRFQKRNHKDSVKNDAMNLATKGGKNVSVRFLTFGLICITNNEVSCTFSFPCIQQEAVRAKMAVAIMPSSCINDPRAR